MTVPPPVVVPALIEPLLADLHRTGFTVEGVRSYLGPVAAAALERDEPIPAERRTRHDDSPLGALVRLFALSVEVDFDAVDAALPSAGGEALIELGLAERAGAALRARADLRPYADEARQWWIASDLTPSPGRGPLRPSHVTGVGGASVTLAQWTPRPDVSRALDLGTGCGVQALHLVAHAGEVVGTDLSARALAFARFNLALAGVDAELRRGSMFEPVAGERFDLVVSNPPYVITPRTARVPVFGYRDGGEPGDGIVEKLVRQAGEHLAPGGIAHFIGNWEIPAGADWTGRLRGWLDGTGLDALVIQRDVQDPAQYAATWARDGGHLPDSWMHDELYASWLDDFASRGVGGIGFGVVTLQRPRVSREPFTDLMEVTGPVELPMGPAVLAMLRERTWLAENATRDLLSARLRVAPDVTIERHHVPGQAEPAAIVLRQGGGLRRVVQVDAVCAAVADVADGELTLDQSLVAIAAVLGQDAEATRRSALPVVRQLLSAGLLHRS